MAHINRSDLAESDLLEIGRYIARDNIDAALRMLDRIDQKCKILAGNPLLGEGCPELGEDIRHFTVRPYVIIYRPLDDGIELVRVLHGARDIPAIFKVD
jgi:toxin ParE1/3/4